MAQWLQLSACTATCELSCKGICFYNVLEIQQMDHQKTTDLIFFSEDSVVVQSLVALCIELNNINDL